MVTSAQQGKVTPTTKKSPQFAELGMSESKYFDNVSEYKLILTREEIAVGVQRVARILNTR